MKRVLALLVLLAAAAACARSDRDAAERDPEPAAPPRVAERAETPASRPRIVFLGDSLTAGYGLAKEQSVPALIQRRLVEEGYEYEVVNQGVSGDTSAGGVSRLDWSLDGDVKVLVLELGANDGLRGLPADSTRRYLDEIITRAKARGIRVLLAGMEAPPNHGPVYTSEFREVFRDLARTHKIALVPFYLEGVAGIPALNQSDGIHPNTDGNVIVERTIWKHLEPLLEKTDR